MGNDAMIPAKLANNAIIGLVPKQKTAISNPIPNATIPVLSAAHRLPANK